MGCRDEADGDGDRFADGDGGVDGDGFAIGADVTMTDVEGP